MVDLPWEVKVGSDSIPVDYKDGIRLDGVECFGLYTQIPRKIQINTEDVTFKQQLSSLVHEMAHAYVDQYALMQGKDTVTLDEEGLVQIIEAVMINLLWDNPDIVRVIGELTDGTSF